MSDILDLDALVPEPKKIKINGKIIDVNPPTLKQLIHLQKITQVIGDEKLSPQDVIEKYNDVLASLIPAIKTDPDIDFTPQQFQALIQFIINMVNSPNTNDSPSEKKIE